MSVPRENIYHRWVQQVYSHVKSVPLEIIAQNPVWSTRCLVRMDLSVHLGRRAWDRQTSRVRLAIIVAADQRNEDVLLAHTRLESLVGLGSGSNLFLG